MLDVLPFAAAPVKADNYFSEGDWSGEWSEDGYGGVVLNISRYSGYDSAANTSCE